MSVVKNFAKHVAETNIKNLYLILGEDDGRSCWYYLSVNQLKLPIFIEQIKNLPYRLELDKLGVMLCSGWGESPPIVMQEKIKNGEIEGLKSGNEVLYVDSKDAGGNDFFAFVSVPYPLVDTFKQKVAVTENFVLQEWGTVLHWGWGKAQDSDHEMMKWWTQEESNL